MAKRQSVEERFRARMEERRGVEVEFDGFPLRLQYAPLEVWVQSGRVPQTLAAAYVAAQTGRGGAGAAVGEGITDEEQRDYLEFKRRVVEFCSISPKIVFDARELANGEMSAEEVAAVVPGLLDFIYFFALRLQPGATIRTKGGEVEVDSLSNFRDDGDGPEKPVGIIVHGANVQPAAVGAAGD